MYILGYVYICEWFTVVYTYMCDENGTGTHYVLYECNSTYMYTLCTMISAALLFVPSVRPMSARAQNKSAPVRPGNTPVFSRQSFSSDSMGSDSGITSREGWCTTDAVNRKEMSVL